jgi:hypothetical protein
MSAGRTVGVGIAFAGAAGLALTRSAGLSGDGVWIGLAMLPLWRSPPATSIERGSGGGERPLDLASR